MENKIGLEYILQISGMQHQELAEKLGIKKQNINLWIKGAQRIPKKHLPKLSEIFELPEELFEKEFTEIDKLKVQSSELEKDIKKSKVMIERDLYDDKSRKWISIEEPYYNENAMEAQRITDTEIGALEIIEKVKQDIFDVTDDIESTEDYIAQVSSVANLYKRFNDLRRNGKTSDYTLKQVLYCLTKLPELKIAETDIENITEEEADNFNFEEDFEALLIRKKKMDMYQQKQWNDLGLFDEEAQELY